MNLQRQDIRREYGLCSSCGDPATLADGFGQYCSTACRDDYYGPVAWQRPEDERPAGVQADEVSAKMERARI